MKYIISVKRQKSSSDAPHYVNYEYTSDGDESISTMLENLNKGLGDPVKWQCSCLQKKCGACAMVINGVPRLACSTFLKNLGSKIKLEPLSKFPVVSDLIVDRGYIFDKLREMKMWNDGRGGTGYDRLKFGSASCLMCGCCLEVCPAFSVSSGHMGAVGAAAAYRAGGSGNTAKHLNEIKKAYTSNVFSTCDRSFSCAGICPAGLPVDELMAKNIRFTEKA